MNIQMIQELAEVMRQYGLSEAEVEVAGLKARLRIGGDLPPVAATQVAASAPAVAVAAPAAPPASEPAALPTKDVTAPIVGVFHSLQSMNREPLQVGDAVTVGQVVCGIEAMKLINNVESTVAGTIAEICVGDGDMVEYGQPLMKLI